MPIFNLSSVILELLKHSIAPITTYAVGTETFFHHNKPAGPKHCNTNRYRTRPRGARDARDKGFVQLSSTCNGCNFSTMSRGQNGFMRAPYSFSATEHVGLTTANSVYVTRTGETPCRFRS